MPIGVPNNMIQYFALLLIVARFINLKPYEFVHTISDAHIYENQIEKVKELIKIEPKPFPTLNFEGEDGKHPRDYHYTDFSLSDYNPNSEINFPVVV
jgi:thymidylate synthase